MSQATISSQPSAGRGGQPRADTWRAIAVCGLLVVAVLLVFSRTFSQGFSNFDDGIYVHAEPRVSGGFSWSGIVWALTKGPQGDWCPLSALSHMLDCQLYGLEPAGHHVTNVLLHAASAVLLFLVLWRMTSRLWPSALVAALFALHPLRVESVAWIAERRDVLSGLFFMLTLGAYVAYVRRPQSLARYLAVVGLFALGLTAKSILVTMPGLLLLLDFWPLGRLGGISSAAAAASLGREITPPAPLPTPFPWRVVWEKVPLVAVALAATGVTAIRHGGPASNPILTLPDRLATVAVSCVAYLGQMFVPVGLSVFYPYPDAGWPRWQVAAATALLLAITAAAVILRRSAPYLFVGWFWYVGMLLPVLELIPVGRHARADRYTYLSQIGLYIALVWGAMRLGGAWPARRWVFAVGSALVLAALAACTWRQTGFWQDSNTLWEHALACDPKNAMAHYDLGLLVEEKEATSAEAHYRLAVELGRKRPSVNYGVLAQALNRLANIAARKGDIAGAMVYLQQALDVYPGSWLSHQKLGLLQMMNGNRGDAIVHFQRWTELDPDNADAFRQLADALALEGRTDEAIVQYRKALEIDPHLAAARHGLERLSAR